MKEARLAYLFKKYTHHQCTAEEHDELMRLIDESGEVTLQNLLDEAYTHDADYELTDEASNRILNKIIVPEPARTSLKSFYWLSGVAATILITIALFAWLQPAAKLPVKKAQQVAEKLQSNNDHRFIKLADGSTVTLNKNSQLSYSKEFNRKLREVTLTGEGYFDIRHDSSRPFLVHAGNLTITVLGTAFNVNTINKIAVTVTRGKVSVSDHKKLLGAITPGQQISYDLQTKFIEKTTVNADLAVKWQASDLFFDNVTMKQAADVLENRFNKKIRFESTQSENYVFSASFTHGQNLQQIIEVICAFNKTSYQKDGDTIIIQ